MSSSFTDAFYRPSFWCPTLVTYLCHDKLQVGHGEGGHRGSQCLLLGIGVKGGAKVIRKCPDRIVLGEKRAHDYDNYVCVQSSFKIKIKPSLKQNIDDGGGIHIRRGQLTTPG